MVDAATLTLLLEVAGASPYTARCISLLLAIAATWWCNRRFTFRVTRPAHYREWTGYLLLMLAGAALNYGIYTLGILFLPVAALPWRALAALAIATIATMLVNYNTMRVWVFREAGETRD